jgi:eukaryotic-like serine/threonine-protein kinase
MDAKRWAQVDQLLDEALLRAPDERAAFLAEACADDEALRQEVVSLLVAHDKAEAKFLNAPALEVAAQKLAKEQNRSLVGKMLGPYSVLSVLGAGGMGEVYLAQDRRLNRKLALKLLPPQFTQDAARVKRFAREARAASALNHPHIITIYEIGEFNGEHFIATEYVDGQTLRELLRRGPLPIKEISEIGWQIAAALAAAHAAGIVHRDIKPENVMRRRDGYLKVLDFGLAKLLERASSLGATKGSGSDLGKTNPGTVLGTVSYMSPEQARGEEVDQRSDLFSLGVLLYELLAGVPPFKGDTTAATLDAIVHHQPLPLAQLRPDAPPELERIINHCLEKDRELRYQTANDFGAELKRVQRELDSAASGQVHSGALPAQPRRLRNYWRWAAGVCALLVAGLATSWAWRVVNNQTRRGGAPLWSRAQMLLLTEHPDLEEAPSLSPDGTNVIYIRKVNGQWDIFRQRVGGNNPQNLTPNSPENDTAPALSHDGNFIAFRSERGEGGIYVMGETGENPRRVCDGFNPAWSPDDKEIVYSTRRAVSPNYQLNVDSHLEIINLATGAIRRVAGSENALQPYWSPNGARIAYWGLIKGTHRDIWTIPATGGAPMQVTADEYADWYPIWSPEGRYLYFGSSRSGRMNLWRVALDEKTGQRLGEPELVPTQAFAIGGFSLSADGRRLAFAQPLVRENIQRVAFDPATERATGQPVYVMQGARRPASMDLSSDGQMLTYYSYLPSQLDIYVTKADGSEQPRQLTNDVSRDRQPRWSPDGQWIAFYSDISGHYEIWLIKADGSERRQLTFTEGDGVVDPAWSPKGDKLSYGGRHGGSFIIELNKSWHEQTPVALPQLPGGSFVAEAWSPDGQYIAGVNLTKDGVADGIIIYSLATQKYERVTEIGDEVGSWLADSRHFLIPYKSQIYLVNLQTKKLTEIFALPPFTLSSARLASDKRFLYFTSRIDESDIMLLSLPAAER